MKGFKRMIRSGLMIAVGVAAAGMAFSLTGCGSSASSGSKHLLVAHSHSESHPVHVGLTKLTEVAEDESDLTFSVYPNGTLGGNAEMIQLVKAGVLDIAKVSASSMEQFNSAYAIFSLPYVFESTEQYFDVMNNSEAVQEIFDSTYDQGFFAIGWFDSGARSIYTVKDEVCDSPSVLKGLKIRTQDSQTSIAMIRAMGASATPMSSGETYTGLQQGIIDGAENNETVLVQDGHGEVCKAYTYTEHQMVPDIVIISTRTWESLDESEQKAIKDGIRQGNEAHEAVWGELVQENIDGAKEMGVNFYTIDKTPFIEATQSLRDEFCAKSENNARYYQDFLSYAK